jgi:hypothetical protein
MRSRRASKVQPTIARASHTLSFLYDAWLSLVRRDLPDYQGELCNMLLYYRNLQENVFCSILRCQHFFESRVQVAHAVVNAALAGRLQALSHNSASSIALSMMLHTTRDYFIFLVRSLRLSPGIALISMHCHNKLSAAATLHLDNATSSCRPCGLTSRQTFESWSLIISLYICVRFSKLQASWWL